MYYEIIIIGILFDVLYSGGVIFSAHIGLIAVAILLLISLLLRERVMLYANRTI